MRSRTKIVRSMGFGGAATNKQISVWGTTCIACQLVFGGWPVENELKGTNII